MGTIAAHRESIERIAAVLERRGDLIALNEHLFDSMWTYWRAAQFTDCIACCDRATALANRLGIPPVQYGTIKSFALLDLGRFDEAWQALEQEVSDDEHPFGQAFKHLGRTFWYASAGDFERVIRHAPRVLADARKLQRSWMIPWADDLVAATIVASAADGTSEADLRARVETAGGHLAGESLVAAQLRAGNAEAALAECERRLPQLEREGRVRAYWIFEELRIQALLALDRLHEVCSAVETALSFIVPLGWRSLAWRLQASQVAALDELGDERAAMTRRTAVELLTAVAGTLRDSSVRSHFLSQRVAAGLLE
jgi:tetratricopeptide (TPR) repeat protein